MSKLLRASIVLVVILGLISSTGLAVANGPVEPPAFGESMYPGTSIEIAKEVTTPLIPPIVDICLLEDETGSFYDDIANLQAAAPGLYAAIDDASLDAQFAVAGFRDYPEAPYGITGDWVYHLLSTMSPAQADWLAGVTALTASGGNDEPEAQYDAIVAAAGPGVFNDPTLLEQPSCGWRDEPGVQRVLVVATDAPFHVPDGTHVNDAASTLAALQAEDIILIGLKGAASPPAVGPGTELDYLADQTGGSVQALSSDGANIAEAILAALEELDTDVWWTEDCGPDLDVSLTPDVHYGVPGTTTVSFVETIAVPNTTPPGDYNCTVTFWANEYPEEGAEIGTQDIHVEVIPLPVPVDIKPTSCPNPLNTRSKGVLPVAILGADGVDVTTIDPATVRLEGVAPLRWGMEDVATPFEPWLGKSDCRKDCTTEGADGYMDLTLKFKTQEVVAVLDAALDRECMVLTLTGNFFDGRAFEGEDVVLILYRGE
jgi:hypothetical protein